MGFFKQIISDSHASAFTGIPVNIPSDTDDTTPASLSMDKDISTSILSSQAKDQQQVSQMSGHDSSVVAKKKSAKPLENSLFNHAVPRSDSSIEPSSISSTPNITLDSQTVSHNSVQQVATPRIQRKPVQAQTAISRQISDVKTSKTEHPVQQTTEPSANTPTQPKSKAESSSKRSNLMQLIQSPFSKQESLESKDSVVSQVDHSESPTILSSIHNEALSDPLIQNHEHSSNKHVHNTEVSAFNVKFSTQTQASDPQKVSPSNHVSIKPSPPGHTEVHKPQVRIGQVNVMVEGPKQVAPVNKKAADHDLSSRLFLRGL